MEDVLADIKVFYAAGKLNNRLTTPSVMIIQLSTQMHVFVMPGSHWPDPTAKLPNVSRTWLNRDQRVAQPRQHFTLPTMRYHQTIRVIKSELRVKSELRLPHRLPHYLETSPSAFRTERLRDTLSSLSRGGGECSLTAQIGTGDLTTKRWMSYRLIYARLLCDCEHRGKF